MIGSITLHYAIFKLNLITLTSNYYNVNFKFPVENKFQILFLIMSTYHHNILQRKTFSATHYSSLLVWCLISLPFNLFYCWRATLCLYFQPSYCRNLDKIIIVRTIYVTVAPYAAFFKWYGTSSKIEGLIFEKSYIKYLAVDSVFHHPLM